MHRLKDKTAAGTRKGECGSLFFEDLKSFLGSKLRKIKKNYKLCLNLHLKSIILKGNVEE